MLIDGSARHVLSYRQQGLVGASDLIGDEMTCTDAMRCGRTHVGVRPQRQQTWLVYDVSGQSLRWLRGQVRSNRTTLVLEFVAETRSPSDTLVIGEKSVCSNVAQSHTSKLGRGGSSRSLVAALGACHGANVGSVLDEPATEQEEAAQEEVAQEEVAQAEAPKEEAPAPAALLATPLSVLSLGEIAVGQPLHEVVYFVNLGSAPTQALAVTLNTDSPELPPTATRVST